MNALVAKPSLKAFGSVEADIGRLRYVLGKAELKIGVTLSPMDKRRLIDAIIDDALDVDLRKIVPIVVPERDVDAILACIDREEVDWDRCRCAISNRQPGLVKIKLSKLRYKSWARLA